MHDPVEDSCVDTPKCCRQQFWRQIVCGWILDVQAWIAGWTSWVGSGANPRDFPRAGSISLPVHRRILRAELWALWQAIILSEPGATFVSDCATVLRGLERGPRWCTAARRPHAGVWRRICDCFRDIGDEAHIDSVTKCEAHLSKVERAKLDETGRLMAAGNETGRRNGQRRST